MPTNVRTGYQGGKAKTPRNPTTEHEGRVPQPGVPTGPRNANGEKAKTVVTISPTGHVSATGPGAAAGKAEAEKSVERSTTAKTAATKYELEHGGGSDISRRQTFKPKGLGIDLGSIGKKILKDAEVLSPGGSTPRHYLAEEAGNIAAQAKKNLNPSKLPEPAHAPTSKEWQAFGTIVGGAKGADEAAGAGEKALAKVASNASNAETAAKTGAKIVAKLKNAPKGALKDAKEYPGKKVRAVKSAPARAKATVARAPELKTKAGQKAAAKAAGKTSLKHPLKTGVPAAAALPPGTEINGFDPGQRARAFIEGTAAAANPFGGHLPETLETTGKGALGFLTAPVALAGAGVASVKEGSAKPLATEASTLAKGTLDLGKKLASGNAKEVEETTRKETGLVPFIPVPHFVKRLKGSDTVEGVRGAVRGAVEDRRASARDSRIAAEKAAQEGGDFVPRKSAKKIRQSVADTSRPGEKYVLRRTGKLVEKQRSRHHVSREVARMQEEGEFAGKRESESVAKALRKSKGTDHSQQNDSDALAVILKHGLPLDHTTLDFARRLKEGYGDVQHGEIPAGVHLDRHSVQWILDHPEMFQGKRGEHLAKAVQEFDRQSKDVATSRRHKYIAQVVNLINPILGERGKPRILLPEERIPEATRRLLPSRPKATEADERQIKVRMDKGDEAVKSARDDLAIEEKHLKEGQDLLQKFKPIDGEVGLSGRLADSADRLDQRKRDVTVAEEARHQVEQEYRDMVGAQAWAGQPWTRSQALDFAKNTKDKNLAKAIRQSLDGLMKLPEHGGAAGGISTTQADAYTPEMEKEFAEQASKAAKEIGLREPSPYVANKVPRGLKGEDKAPDFGAQLPLRKIWPSRGLAARSGNAQSDFEHLIHSSIEAPRQRKAVVKGLNRIFDKASRDVGGKRYLTEAEVEKAINQHKVPDGTVFLRTQALKSVLEGEHTLDSEGFRQLLEKEIEAGQAMASSGQLATEMKDLKLAKGEKFAPMDAAAVNELMGHLQPLGKVTTFMAHGTNLATRTILNSPAFAAIQIPQEGLPLAAALGANVMDVPGAIANLSEIAKLPAEDQAAIKAVVGSSVGVLGAPSTKALRADGYMDPIRAAGGTPAWRHAWNLVNGNTIGKFDRTRAGLFREIAADAKVQGDFRKAAKGFNVWRKGANNLFKGEEQAVEAMKGMNRAERMAYVSAHPVLGDKLMQAMNDMAGNWNSFTVFEKHFAPLTVFYPFQRYSVLWMLYHFPLDHPVVATALATLGQVNAQELRSIAAEKGSKPSILDYTMPVVNTGSGKTVLPAGQRIFPGLSTLQQAAVTGNPAQLIGEASPPLAIAIEGATGKSAYTGQDIGENGWIYMLRQAGNLSPFARFIGIPNLGKTQSATSKAYEAEDPLRKFRSTIDPFIGQTAGQYGGVKKLEKEEDTAHDPSKAVPGPFDMPNVQKLLYGGNGGGPEPKLLPQVLREIHEGEAAKGFLKGKTQSYYGEEHPFSELQDELLKAVEGAWETGPNGKTKSSGGQYGSGEGQYSSGPGQYSTAAGQYGG